MKDQLRDRSGNTLANLVFYFSTDPTLKESKRHRYLEGIC